MNFFRSAFQRMLDPYNIVSENTKRCDLLDRQSIYPKFNPASTEGAKNLQKLFKRANHPDLHPIIKLKYLMLIHYLLLRSNKFYQHVMQNQLDYNQIIISELKKQSKNTRQVLTSLVTMYYKYIRKLCAINTLYEECKNNINSKYRISNKSRNDLIENVYMIMNLLKYSFCMKDIVLYFGRYYKEEYPVIIDFNRMMSWDLAKIYIYLAHLVTKLYEDFNQLNKNQVRQLINIVDEIFIIHEGLYLFFYNRYYHTNMQLPEITWFKLGEVGYQQMRSKLGDKKKKKIKINDLDISEFEKTYFSSIDEQKKFEQELPQI